MQLVHNHMLPCWMEEVLPIICIQLSPLIRMPVLYYNSMIYSIFNVLNVPFICILGIRSLSFHNELVTIGTGFGSCSFLDLKTKRFIQTQEKNVCQLKAKEGFRVCGCRFHFGFNLLNSLLSYMFQRHDEVYHTLFGEMCLPTSIYTHCYDQSGSKLFTGGGPLAVGLYGNYAALWQ